MTKEELQIKGFHAYQAMQLAQQQIQESQQIIMAVNEELAKLEETKEE